MHPAASSSCGSLNSASTKKETCQLYDFGVHDPCRSRSRAHGSARAGRPLTGGPRTLRSGERRPQFPSSRGSFERAERWLVPPPAAQPGPLAPRPPTYCRGGGRGFSVVSSGPRPALTLRWAEPSSPCFGCGRPGPRPDVTGAAPPSPAPSLTSRWAERHPRAWQCCSVRRSARSDRRGHAETEPEPKPEPEPEPDLRRGAAPPTEATGAGRALRPGDAPPPRPWAPSPPGGGRCGARPCPRWRPKCDDIPIRTWFPKENLFSFQTATTTMQAVFRGYAERKRRKRENDSASVIQRNFRKHLRMVGSRRVKAQTFAERRERSFSRSWSDPTPMKADTSHDSRDSSDLQSSHGTLGEAFEDLDWETERGLEAVACDTEGFVPPKVMLISSKVPKAEYIPTILRRDDPSIIPILYDHEHATFEDILEEIEKKLNVYHKGAKIWKMLIFCQGGPGHLYLLKNKVATFAKVEKEEDMIHFWKRLSHLMSKVNPEPNVIHVMGCYVLGNPNGEKLFQNLRTLMTPYRVTFESPLELSAQGASPTPMGLTWKERAFTALLGAAAVSGLTTLILFLVEATNVLLPADTKFGIVFDAGSSHTSLFVYQWLANKENDTGVVSQALACRAKGPGISSYASDPAQAGESLQGCLEEALALIPKAKRQQTPMFLGATGGMRLLSQKNSSQAEDVFAAVSQALSRSPVAFWGAELLAGQDEGALGWVTINYVLGLLVQYSFSGEWIQPLEGTLVGALDMGGASTQITFVPGGPILDTTAQATFRLYGTEHSVYTHSYLCFGRDQMLNRLLAGLVQVGCSAGGGRGTLPGGCSEVPPPSPQSSPSLLVRHPCYHSGYRGTLALAPLYGSPCVQAAAPRDLGQNLTVEGTGNPGACVAAIRGLFNFSSCDGRGDCAFDSVYQPPVRGQFYAAAGHGQCHHLGVLPEALEAGGGELARAGRPAARLLCLGPVHPHTPARGLRVQPGDLGRHRVPRAGRWHRHRLDAGLHAEPDQPDPSRGARPVAGTELWRLGGRSRLFGADPHGHSRGHCGAALAPGLGWLPPGAGRQRPELAGAFLSPDPQGSPCGLWPRGHMAPFCHWGHSGHRGCTVAPTMAFRCRRPSRFPMLHEGWAIATPAALRAV
ncbi:NMDA receptor synaptonuclear signaling and neuronal migration factor isoform X16 [Tursiops truncatus]|uniref:NMDA receptor synaptonuclear signaling and neuronal migration factor isoform X16 n=1 Tax=Tursiops truncatus TaxID=9739 RepID=UPI003CCF7D4B